METKFMPVKDFWIPRCKSQYVEFFYKQYPFENPHKWARMTKDRLRAIYLNMRCKKG